MFSPEFIKYTEFCSAAIMAAFTVRITSFVLLETYKKKEYNQLEKNLRDEKLLRKIRDCKSDLKFSE